MSYEKQNFVKGQILKADHLNHMEDGIAAAAVGVQGPKGDKGDVGPQGPKGDKGDTGPAATLDPTLSVSGNAADAKATGDAVSQLREDLGAVNREVNSYSVDVPVKFYRILFDSVWDSKKNQQSASASAAEVHFYGMDGAECVAASVQADSEYASSYAAGNVLDGNLDTFWSSANAAGVIHSLAFVLEKPEIAEKIGIVLRKDMLYGLIDGMTVQASADGVSWTDVLHVEGIKDGWAVSTWRYFDLGFVQQQIQSVRQIAQEAASRADEARTCEYRTGVSRTNRVQFALGNLNSVTVYGKTFFNSAADRVHAIRGHSQEVYLYQGIEMLDLPEHLKTATNNGIDYACQPDRSILMTGQATARNTLLSLTQNGALIPENIKPGDRIFFDHATNYPFPYYLRRFRVDWKTDERKLIRTDWIDIYENSQGANRVVIVPENAARWYVVLYTQPILSNAQSTFLAYDDLYLHPIIGKVVDDSFGFMRIPLEHDLYALTDDRDYAEIGTDGIRYHRLLAKRVFDGSESWTMTDEGYPSLALDDAADNSEVLVNLYDAEVSGTSLVVKTDDYATTDDWKTYLSGLSGEKFQALYRARNEEIVTGGNGAAIAPVGPIATILVDSQLAYSVTMKHYVDLHESNVSLTYVTPEDFGAIGDGVTDDSVAYTRALEYAIKNNLTFLAHNRYNVESNGVHVNCDNMRLTLGTVIYMGDDCAIIIEGNNNQIEVFDVISSGSGLRITDTSGAATIHNSICINTITAGRNGIELIVSQKYLYQNQIKFNHIKAGGDYGHYCIYLFNSKSPDWIGQHCINENTFIGGHCSNAEWAYYAVDEDKFNCIQSKLYNIQVEENIKGCFYIEGSCVIRDPRVYEAGSAGEYRVAFKTGKNVNCSKIDMYPYIRVNTICPDADDYEDKTDASGNIERSSIAINKVIELNFPIVSPFYTDPFIISRKSYMWGKYLIFTPMGGYIHQMTTATLDLRSNLIFGDPDADISTVVLNRLPTDFQIMEDCTIYLHPSYCPIGYNEFYVRQQDGKKAQIYDINDRLIYDGTQYENGEYRVRCCQTGRYVWINGFGMEWVVSKVG